MRIFADDTVIYREISTEEDCVSLSRDLIRIQRWCEKWQIDLNVSNCSVVNFFERKQMRMNKAYQINELEVNVVESVKYLGITLINNLNWSTHIRNICGKANRKLGFIRRIVGKSDERVRERCHFALVRPQLDARTNRLNECKLILGT